MALDVCSTNVVVTDPQQRVIYFNRSSGATLERIQEALQQDLPGFSLVGFMGSDLTDFHSDPAAHRQTLAELSATREEDLLIGGCNLSQIATPVFNDVGIRLGTALEWSDRTAEVARLAREQAHREEEARIAAENLRIRVALDNVSSSVMMADPERRILYVNRAAEQLFTRIADDIRKELPEFRPERLVGSNIDAFHKDPAWAELLRTLRSASTSELEIGGLTMRLVANPVISDAGECLGTAVEWSDRTAEVAVETEVEDIVTAARGGDLSRRIDTASKQGFYKELGVGINALIDQVVRILDELGDVMGCMAQGDLTRPMHHEYQGSFNVLKDNVNTTLENLRGIVTELREAMNEMRTAADEISAGNTNLSGRTEQQAASLEKTASSMEELTSTVRNNADNAQQANQLASNARNKAEQGGAVVNQAVQAMDAINGASHKIAEIIGVIDEIAFQTNLLALNASVEAARAGEQGRGFAVVATEVRNLAGRSATAAREIKALIKDSGAKVQLGADLVSQSGITLEEIVVAVKKVGGIIAEIAAASAEQSAGIDQVNLAVTSMDEMTQQNAALAEQTSAASSSMSDKAQELSELIARFRT